ncbi:MAG: hypothetical protein Q4D07_07840 [Selenomonadaceae bacterium]|nr:hypothetical protein [Selenomonadaceae bacterium]
MLRITDFHVPITADGEVSYNNIEPPMEALAARLRLPLHAIGGAAVLRRGIDARRRNGAPISYVYQLEFSLAGGEREEKKFLAACSRGRDGIKNLIVAPEQQPVLWDKASQLREKLTKGQESGESRPVVVGFGPAGMFAALLLARAGLSPLVLERGADVDSRTTQVANFWAGKSPLDPTTNVQFGEGGAGTFSDGKLTTRVDSPLIRDVLEAMVEFGAPEEIRFLHKPHIGTDELVHVVKNLRQEIIARGGEVRFLTTVRELELDSSRNVTAVVTEDGQRIKASAVFLGIGHSARDTYHRLRAMGVAMEPKPFAVGVRIEHPQEIIDRAQYGRPAVVSNGKGQDKEPRLPVADYSLTWQDRSTPNSRSVYSFCMCPGGKVVAAASEEGRLVTNGMSLHARDSGTANAALLVNVRPEDFGGDVLGGIEFQRKYEALAYRAGGGDYTAPVQAVGDFIATVEGSPRCDTKDFCTAPTYRPGVKNALLTECLPEFVTSSLAAALPAFDRKIKGFGASDVPITGVEMRSSAPCRIIRDRESYQSLSHGGLYPIGEGAGYAGGIMSAACDGLNAVLAYLRSLGHNV